MGDLKHKVLNLISGGGAADAVPVPPESHLEPDASRIGVVLRATRVQAGLELRDVATMLKIRHAFMEAIEEGRYQELPGTAYAVGFVRTYADYLGLDGDAVVRRFKDEVAGKVGHQSLYFPTPVPEGRVPGGAVLLVSLLLAAVIYGGWYVLSATDRSVVDVVPALPQRLVSLLGSFGSHNSPPPAPASSGSASAPEVTPVVPPLGSAADASAPAPALPAAAASASTASPPGAPVPAAKPAATPAVAAASPTAAASSAAAPASAAPASVGVAASAGPAGPASGAATGSSATDADAGDEVPLVSGPSDENSGGPGPLVPMAPRTKPAPPVVVDALPPVPADAALPGGPVAPAAAPAATPPVAAVTPPAAATAAPKPAAAPAVAPPPPAAPAPGRVFGNQGGDSRVQVKATQDTWVQIREASGEAIFTKVLHTGDVFRVPDHPGIRLRTGNAGGLQLIIDNGEPTTLGGVGEVLRDVPVDGSPAKRSSGR